MQFNQLLLTTLQNPDYRVYGRTAAQLAATDLVRALAGREVLGEAEMDQVRWYGGANI